jgi:hypothetical protein
MQTDYLFHGIKGFERFAYYCYRYDMVSIEANRRYKIVLFNEKMADWLIDYNTIIPHHSLNMKNPVQYLIENHHECHMLWTNTTH